MNFASEALKQSRDVKEVYVGEQTRTQNLSQIPDVTIHALEITLSFTGNSSRFSLVLEKSVGQGRGLGCCLRKAAFLDEEHVLLPGGSDPRLFLTRPSTLICCDVSEYPACQYIFILGQQESQSKNRSICSDSGRPSLSGSCWVGFKEPFTSESCCDGSRNPSHNRSDAKVIHLEQKQL